MSAKEAAKIVQAAAAAKEEVLSKRVLDLVMNADPDKLTSATETAELSKGNTNGAVCDIHSPANVELFAVACKKLNRAARLDGLNATQVERVHAKLIPGSRVIVIKAASKDDTTAYRVNRYDGSSAAWINLFPLLAQEGLTLESGYKTRFDVLFIPQGSKLWPGLIIDLDQPLERSLESSAKKSKKAKSPAQVAAAKQPTEAAAPPAEAPAKPTEAK